MKQESIQQEILLMINTTFLSREWAESDGSGNKNPLSEKEKLVEACWNGLLYKMLPEVFDQSIENERVYLLQIKEASFFLELELGQYQEARDIYFSIDPYSFLAIPHLN